MKNESLKNEILKKCKELQIPLVGFAPVSRWENPPEELPNKFNEWIPKNSGPNQYILKQKQLL